MKFMGRILLAGGRRYLILGRCQRRKDTRVYPKQYKRGGGLSLPSAAGLHEMKVLYDITQPCFAFNWHLREVWTGAFVGNSRADELNPFVLSQVAPYLFTDTVGYDLNARPGENSILAICRSELLAIGAECN